MLCQSRRTTGVFLLFVVTTLMVLVSSIFGNNYFVLCAKSGAYDIPQVCEPRNVTENNWLHLLQHERAANCAGFAISRKTLCLPQLDRAFSHEFVGLGYRNVTALRYVLWLYMIRDSATTLWNFTDRRHAIVANPDPNKTHSKSNSVS